MIGEMNKYKKVTLDKLKYKHKKLVKNRKIKNVENFCASSKIQRIEKCILRIFF